MSRWTGFNKTDGVGSHTEKIGCDTKSQGFKGMRKHHPKMAKRGELNENFSDSLICICNSGLPVLCRFKVNRKWTGYCKKCKPKRESLVFEDEAEGREDQK